MQTLLIKTLCLLIAIGLLTTDSWATWTIQDETGVAITGFALTVSSPCLDVGFDASYDFNFDFDSVSRPQGAGWDMGPFELESTPAFSPTQLLDIDKIDMDKVDLS